MTHQPVLLKETLELLAVRPGGRYIDGTVGLGGHTEALLEQSTPDGRVLGIDRDPEALRMAGARLHEHGHRLVLVHGNYADVVDVAEKANFTGVDGILVDAGVSSMQLDDADRGFSFMRDGPLDMRMNTTQRVTAADLVNGLSEQALAEIIFRLGEEPASRRIAASIVRERTAERITTTGRLAAIVVKAKGGRIGKIHPATQTFQALRMAVNDEIESLRKGLDGALLLLRPGGRLAVITFHSLEDREVKQCFKEHVAREESLPQGGSRKVGRAPYIVWVNKKAISADSTEIRKNPRARSAKLRVVERTN
ncbi:MAG TPA: 16S rRNA (cytosine(1402)-N(4))-methyltransferase RsmH [Kiritimatiellia bacterium]|nr:16S rRNA (cytosine(1402)-N(4))-methyltransferase RsmH [Kiritimatiellia bacterium]